MKASLLFSILLLKICAHADIKEEVIDLRRAHTGRSLKTTYHDPLMIVKGEKQYLFDEKGIRYLDAYNNVAHVGHCHPSVVEAGAQQMAELNTNTRYLHPLMARYAKRITDTLPEELDVVFFVNSGSEANDLAYQLARKFTGNELFVNIEHSYHGTTYQCMQLSDTKKIPSAHITVPFPDIYRSSKSVDAYVAEFRGDTFLAGFIFETIQGCGGNNPLPSGYLEAVAPLVRARGGLMIADEVQTGFGRTGEHFWAFQAHDIVPDIVTMGKPMGNGFPLSAVVTTKEIADSFADAQYFNTFGGSTLSCAVGMAVMDVIEEEGLQQKAEDVGSYLMQKLGGLQHDVIGRVQGKGLFIGIDLVYPKTLKRNVELAESIVNRLKDEHHILINCEMNVLRIKPPLCFTKENADELIQALDGLL